MRKKTEQKEIIIREPLVRERLEIEEMLIQNGFDLSEFKWRTVESRYISHYRVACLVFKAKSFYFQFDYLKHSLFGKEPIRWSVRSPGYHQVEDWRPDSLWEGQRIFVYDWLDLLKKELGRVTPGSMQLSREVIFFKGQFYGAFRSIRDIVSQAGRELVLIDGYVDHSVLDLLAFTPPLSSISILMRPRQVNARFRSAASAFKRQYPNSAIRASDSFHDRFIFVDDTDFYHIGASLNHLGARGFMFSRIEEPVIIDALRKEFKREWDNATSVV